MNVQLNRGNGSFGFRSFFFILIVAMTFFTVSAQTYSQLCLKYNVAESQRGPIRQFLLTASQEERNLIILVNKNTGVTVSYKPADLVSIPAAIPHALDTMKLRSLLIPDLQSMVSDAQKDGVQLRVVSAFRSYETQQRIFNGMIQQYGKEYAQRVSAPPGHSQHQLGTAIDFNSLEEEFGDSPEGKWLAQNAYKYGFVISYPKGREAYTGYMYEPWHYRYLGKRSALIAMMVFSDDQESFLRFAAEFYALPDDAQQNDS